MESQRNLRIVLLLQFSLEKGFCLCMNPSCDQAGRKHLKLFIIPRHIRIVSPAGSLQMFLNIRNRFLQLQEIGRRLQLRLTFRYHQ